MQLAAGSRLDSYEIIAPLGAGGMGEVYRARDTLLKRDVAIKILPDFWSRDPERLHRFALEAQATAALNHPNIVSIFHVGQSGGSPYLVTELLQGETLRDRLRAGPIPPRQTCEFGVEIARGLAAAHQAGIIHRDLKPENLFLTRGGGFKILDFGLAKFTLLQTADVEGATVTMPEQTDPGHVLGTVGYMSPEQVCGRTADARSDIFAFGAVLFEMLTGKRAFRKPTSAETISSILKDELPPISQCVPDIPPSLDRIVSRCLQKQPEQRFQSASDLAFALETSFVSGSTAVPVVRDAVSGRRRSSIAAGALLLLVATALFVWRRLPPALPVVEAVTQLTNDGAPKAISGRLETDGSRLYFNEGTMGGYRIAQVSISGGATAVVPTTLPSPQIGGLTRDGSSLMVGAGDAAVLPMWEIRLPAGEPRRLGSIDAYDSDYFPDGRILFSKGNELFVAEQDGSEPRKLLTAGGPISNPTVSPDGRKLVLTVRARPSGTVSIDEANADGSDLHPIVNSDDTGRVCCARWTPDAKYIVFRKVHHGQNNLWILFMQPGFLRPPQPPVQLTNGPLAYMAPVVSRDGKQIFAVGIKARGELVRYDQKIKQFIPLLPGIPAYGATFSRSGDWVAYTVYPDHALWRSHSDGTDPLQLTFPPVQVLSPSISPDGRQVVYATSAGAYCLVSMDGGSPRIIAQTNSRVPNWSPDGRRLVFLDSGTTPPQYRLLDLQTGERTAVPGATGLYGLRWAAEDTLVAATTGSKKLMTFDTRSGKWSDLVSATRGDIVNWANAPDYKYVYYSTAGQDTAAWRVRLADRQVEMITSLKSLPRAVGPTGTTYISVAPDGSPVFTRDLGTQEIYALTVRWP